MKQIRHRQRVGDDQRKRLRRLGRQRCRGQLGRGRGDLRWSHVSNRRRNGRAHVVRIGGIRPVVGRGDLDSRLLAVELADQVAGSSFFGQTQVGVFGQTEAVAGLFADGAAANEADHCDACDHDRVQFGTSWFGHDVSGNEFWRSS